MIYEYRADQELPTIPLEWRDGTDTVIDFSSGWTATVKVCAASAPTTILLTKTTGITLAATSPNYTIEWTAADFTALGTIAANGTLFVVYVYVRRNADSKDRVFPGAPLSMRVLPAPA